MIRHLNKKAGFSITELLMAVAILGILATLAAPGFSDFIQRQRISSQAEVINSALSLARNEAITRLADVQLCWNPETAANDKTVAGFAIVPGNLAILEGTGVADVIADVEYDTGELFSIDDEADNCVTFNSAGRLDLATVDGGSFVFGLCSKSGEAEHSLGVIVSYSGRAKIADNHDQGVIACS